MNNDTENNDLTTNSEKIDQRIGCYKYSMENAQNLAQFADSKANILIAIHSVIITIVSAVLFFEDVRSNLQDVGGWEWLGVVPLLGFVGCLVISTFCSIWVLLPREAEDDASLFYYKTIAKGTLKTYVKSFEGLSHAKIADAFAHQAHAVSKIVKEKMNWVKRSLILMLIYLVCLLMGSFIFFV